VKTLRHHSFEQVQRIDSDEGVYSQLRFLVQRAAAGQMATLFMYGMTGSGKTYSTNLIFRAAPAELVAEGPVTLTSYELVGKRCFDLLGDKEEVHLRIGEDGATHVQGATGREARTGDALEALLREASCRRETAATGTNATSSRSHAVYHLRTASGGTLTVIDLAGNEGNIESQYHSKELMKEAAEINTSLSVLQTCIAARASGQAHVPYRESVLTRVLRDAFTQEGATTAVLCCVSPACSHEERTLVTLRSAVRLTGCGRPTEAVDEELHEEGIVKGGPSKWDAEAVLTWLDEQEFAGKVIVPAGTTGPQIMKLTAARLAPLCGQDMTLAKQLFAALRAASSEAAALDLEARRAMKAGPKPASSLGFSMRAPNQPITVA
jgi:kinesin family protein 2/24